MTSRAGAGTIGLDMSSPARLTDRYQLTMLAAYAESGHAGRRAVFELFVRRLPPTRRFLLACGLGRALPLLDGLAFTPEDLARFDRDPVLGPALARPRVRALFEGFRFSGRVFAVPEGRVAFPGEPLVRVEGTLAEAQLVETLLLSIFNHDTRVASKCARIVLAAKGRPCLEFGTRRAHERAAVDAARAAYVAGFSATSNEEAGHRWGVPVAGTMAHSYVLAHAADGGEDGEQQAFASYAALFGGATTCLVDTFDPLRGVDRAIAAVGASLRGVRIDSGDLAALGLGARERLDHAGLQGASVVLSDDLDEVKIARLLDDGVPVSAFGVGTMAVATPDAPSLGAVYKLVALEDARGELVAVQKRAPGKGSSAGPKQVLRRGFEDLVGLAGEPGDGEPLLVEALGPSSTYDRSLEAARARARADLSSLPAPIASLAPRADGEGYPVSVSPRLRKLQDDVARDGKVTI